MTNLLSVLKHVRVVAGRHLESVCVGEDKGLYGYSTLMAKREWDQREEAAFLKVCSFPESFLMGFHICRVSSTVPQTAPGLQAGDLNSDTSPRVSPCNPSFTLRNYYPMWVYPIWTMTPYEIFKVHIALHVSTMQVSIQLLPSQSVYWSHFYAKKIRIKKELSFLYHHSPWI